MLFNFENRSTAPTHRRFVFPRYEDHMLWEPGGVVCAHEFRDRFKGRKSIEHRSAAELSEILV